MSWPRSGTSCRSRDRPFCKRPPNKVCSRRRQAFFVTSFLPCVQSEVIGRRVAWAAMSPGFAAPRTNGNVLSHGRGAVIEGHSRYLDEDVAALDFPARVLALAEDPG